jgi:hypothetical protein
MFRAFTIKIDRQGYTFGICFLILFFAQIIIPSLDVTFSFYGPFQDSYYSIFFQTILILFATYSLWRPRTLELRNSYIFLLSSTIFLVGLLFTYIDHQLIRTGFNVSRMKSAFADWLAVFDYLHCREGFGNITCDRFGRPWMYGSGFRLFSVFKSEDAFILLGLVLTFITIALVIYYILTVSNSLVVIAIGLSPSFLFAIDRMNSSFIFLGVCCLIALPFFDLGKKRRAFSSLIGISLNLFKPLFVLSGLRIGFNKFINVMIVASSGLLAYISIGGFKNLEIARNATWYDQHSQFGAQFLGMLFLSGFSEKTQSALGIFILIALTFLTLKKNSSIFLTQSQLAPQFQNLCTATASVYLIGYVSGSQVIYLSLTGIFLPIFLYNAFQVRNDYIKLFLTFGFLGSLGLGFSFFRIFASTCLAVLVFQWLIFVFLKESVFDPTLRYSIHNSLFRK